MVRDVTGGGGFSNVDHLWTVSEERRERNKCGDVAYKSRLKGLVSYHQGTDKHILIRANSTGSWMSLRGTTVSGTLLSATKSRDFLCACYNVSPVNLHSRCDGGVTAFGVEHPLICSIGGLVNRASQQNT